MAEQVSPGSVASSSPTPNWWEFHTNPIIPSSWNNMNPWHPPNPNSNSSCEEEISISNSFTNASNHSGLSIDDSSRDLVESVPNTELTGEPSSENHLWNQVLLSVGSNGELHNGHDEGENFLLSSKNHLSTEMFESDYLKKLDNCWEFPNTSFNSLEKNLDSYNGSLIEHERLTNLSDQVGNWSIAPPDPQLDRQITPTASNISLTCSMDTDFSELKQERTSSISYSPHGNRSLGYFPSYGHELKGKCENHQDIEAREASFLRSVNGIGFGYQMGHNNSVIGDNKKYYYGVPDMPWPNTRNFSDLISFKGCLNKPLGNYQTYNRPSVKGSDSSDSKKQGHEIPSTRVNGRGNGNSTEGKKKRPEDNSETPFKKPKHESSTVSPLKMQTPKVKLADRITALQQIVSPFGKTDTASVLLEAIGYIRFLHEQIQLHSSPYMKSNASKDHTPWGWSERKDKSEGKIDLKSRGLCLIPISCTPQIFHENTGPDYWTPTYRGCLYR